MLHHVWDTWRQDYGILQVAEYRYLVCLEQAHEGRWTPRPCNTRRKDYGILPVAEYRYLVCLGITRRTLHCIFLFMCCVASGDAWECCVNVHANVYVLCRLRLA